MNALDAYSPTGDESGKVRHDAYDPLFGQRGATEDVATGPDRPAPRLMKGITCIEDLRLVKLLEPWVRTTKDQAIARYTGRSW